MFKFIFSLFSNPDGDYMPNKWTKSYRKADDGRNSYDGPCLGQWPVKKRLNEASKFNTEKLRKRA